MNGGGASAGRHVDLFWAHYPPLVDLLDVLRLSNSLEEDFDATKHSAESWIGRSKASTAMLGSLAII